MSHLKRYSTLSVSRFQDTLKISGYFYKSKEDFSLLFYLYEVGSKINGDMVVSTPR